MDALGGNGMDMQSMPPTPPMQQEPPMMDNGMNNDMGDNSDEGLDPKKSLQQLTGKLSQELRLYNDEQEQPDEDLNKYIAGMIIPQATKALTDKGKREVIKKIKKGVTDDEMDDDSSMEDNQQMDANMQIESKIYEIINNILDDDNDTKRTQKVCNKTLPKRNPFRSSR